MGKVVLIHSVLHGMEHETCCKVLARKQSFESGSRCSDGFVLNAPDDLPDRDYTVTFAGHSLPAARRNGIWFTSTDIVRIVR